MARLGERLGVPAPRRPRAGMCARQKGPQLGRAVARALSKLDLGSYSSRELRATAASLVGERVEDWSAERHVILARGIVPPPELHRSSGGPTTSTGGAGDTGG